MELNHVLYCGKSGSLKYAVKCFSTYS